MKTYKLRFEDVCLYEVEADSEEEAISRHIPTSGHRASIIVESLSGYGKRYEVRNEGKTKLIFNDKRLTLGEMKDIMRKMLREEEEWNCDMLVERIFEAQKEKR